MGKQKLFFTGLFLSVFMITTNINSQEVTPGVLITDDKSLEKAEESAILDINSESKGFLPPRLNIKQRDAIEDPAEGLTIFNTTTKKLNYFDGVSWVELGISENESKNDQKLACTADITVTGNPFCVGGTILFNTPTVNNATYLWSGPDGWTSNLQTPVRTNITENMSGVYRLKVMVGSCISEDMINIHIELNPDAQATNTGPYCAGSTIELSTPEVLGEWPGLSYSWSGPNGWTSNLREPTRLNSTILMSGVYTVTTMNKNGCTASSSTNVMVSEIPRFIKNTLIVCEGETISFLLDYGIEGTYSWSGPNNFTSNLPNPSIPNANLTMAGVYTVTLTNNYGCSGTAVTNVIINPKPNVTISGESNYCEGSTINLSVPETTNGSYQWTYGSGIMVHNSRILTKPNAQVSMSGYYYVTVVNSEGCSATNKINVTVSPKPNASATNTGPYCEGQTISLSTPIVSGATYSWSGPGGWTSTLRTPTRTNITSAMAGTYTVTVRNAQGCIAESNTVVIINSKPATPQAGSSISTQTQITWRWSTTNGATGYKWNTTNNYSTAIDMGTGTSRTESGLACSTTYKRYVWAYNNCGYSTTPLVITFNTAACPSCTGEKVMDVDGNMYIAVQIGKQCWLDSNLRTTRYKDGTNIPFNISQTSYGECYSWILNDIGLGEKYGALYSGAAALTGKLCPTGWHVPTNDEWQILIDYSDNLTGVPYGQEAGKVLKDTRCEVTTHPKWNNCTGATNSTGFKALAGGKSGSGTVSQPGSGAYFWTSTPESTLYQYNRTLISGSNSAYQSNADKKYRQSVRCLKDE